MTTEIQKVQHDMPLAQMGGVFARSGFFADAREEAQAIVKIQAGRELGIAPVASMTGIYIVKGRVTLSATVMAAIIRMSERYDYRVLKHTDQECVIEFRGKSGEVLGQSGFTMSDAKRAGLDKGDNWKAYPKNMLYARALSNGAKWYCPDIFAGGAYTPDELGAHVDDEGHVVDVEPVTPAAAPQPAAEPQGEAKPLHPVDQALFAQGDVVDAQVEQPPAPAPQPAPAPTGPDLTKLSALITSLVIPDETIRKWCVYFKVERLEQLSQAQVDAIVRKVETKIKGA